MLRKVVHRIFGFFGFAILSKKNYRQLAKAKRTYAQIGEDMIVSYVFALKGITKPTYLDIGANAPQKINNTFLFYERGATGINIDANPICIEEFFKVRPNDINLNIGIAKEEGQFDFYIMEDDTLSTFSKEEYNKYLKIGDRLKTIVKVPVVSIDSLISKYCGNRMPDFLSIDAEGLDFEILQQINFEYLRPKVICVESSNHSPDGVGSKRVDLINYIVDKEYFEYGCTWLNSIFVDKRWFFENK